MVEPGKDPVDYRKLISKKEQNTKGTEETEEELAVRFYGNKLRYSKLPLS